MSNLATYLKTLDRRNKMDDAGKQRENVDSERQHFHR